MILGRIQRGNSAHEAVRQARAGFTMLEVALAMCLLVVALAAMSASNVGLHGLRIQNRERALALNALRSMSERVQALSSRAHDDPSGWTSVVVNAFSAGGEIGSTFDVSGLTAPGEIEHVGSVQLVTDERETDATLGHALGMPRDLNGDGDAADGDVRALARILPVVLTITWRGHDGVQTLDHALYLDGF